MSKGAQSTVLYPRKDGAKFDMSYYLSTHMPLVAKNWTHYGLKSWSVIELNKDSPYSVSAVLEWESGEAFSKALQGPETKTVMEDVKNFSSEQPVMIVGEIVARG